MMKAAITLMIITTITIHTVDIKIPVSKDQQTLAQVKTKVATPIDTHIPDPSPFLQNLGQTGEAKLSDSPTTEGREKLK